MPTDDQIKSMGGGQVRKAGSPLQRVKRGVKAFAAAIKGDPYSYDVPRATNNQYAGNYTGAKAPGVRETGVRPYVQGEALPMQSVDPAAWFGPQVPIAPVAPGYVKGRQFNTPVGYNIQLEPRAYEAVGFETLRNLADTCDILRLAIETRKDQIEALPWSVKPKGNADTTPALRKKIDEVTKFFQRPDRKHDWSQWIRALLEDLFVIDAATIYRRRTRGGKLYSLDLMDGATIQPLMGDDGRTPDAPQAAYRQVNYGLPAAEFDADELLYLPRNVRTNRLYGYPPTQQVLTTVAIILQRSTSQLAYYTDGSLPDALIGTPENWTPDQITAFQKDWDDMLSGNLPQRRHGRFVPHDFKYQEVKQPPLKDLYDEWLARVICFCFSISPEPFVQHVNRATAESSHDKALEEGLAPVQHWIKRWMDRIVVEDFGYPELEFAFDDTLDIDPKTAADINVEYVKAGVMSINEVRERVNLPAMPEPAYDAPMPLTPTGYVMVVDPDVQNDRAEQSLENDSAPAAAPSGGKPTTEGKATPSQPKPKKAVAKAYGVKKNPRSNPYSSDQSHMKPTKR
jgi:hypothetical protein